VSVETLLLRFPATPASGLRTCRIAHNRSQFQRRARFAAPVAGGEFLDVAVAAALV
jgi:hypothetical protein